MIRLEVTIEDYSVINAVTNFGIEQPIKVFSVSHAGERSEESGIVNEDTVPFAKCTRDSGAHSVVLIVFNSVDE